MPFYLFEPYLHGDYDDCGAEITEFATKDALRKELIKRAATKKSWSTEYVFLNGMPKDAVREWPRNGLLVMQGTVIVPQAVKIETDYEF